MKLTVPEAEYTSTIHPKPYRRSVVVAYPLAPPRRNLIIILHRPRIVLERYRQIIIIRGRETAVVTLVVAALEPKRRQISNGFLP